MKNKPTVSVILPVYNAGKYLAEALDSILNQTYDDFEVIAINDGSSDNSLEILNSYAKRDNRVRVISQKNHGLVYTLNHGISLANGEYIARMDGDDISLPRRFELQVKELKANKEVVLAAGIFEVINEYSEFVRLDVTPVKDADIKRTLHLYNPLAHGSVMFRKEVFLRIGGYRDDVGPTEDFELWTRFAEAGKFICIPHGIFRWRLNPEGITHTVNSYMIEMTKKHINKMWETLPPTVVGWSELRRRGSYYVSNYGERGIKMKLIMLDNNCHIAIKLMAKGKWLAGLRQLFAVALVGRSGVKVVVPRVLHTLRVLIRP